MKAVIISGGTTPSYKLLHKELETSSYLICADSGANCVYNYNMCPNFIVGDLDSIDVEALSYFKNKKVDILEYPPDKDFTDTEIAINKAIDLGVTEIVLLGCTGSRLDHMLGNIGLLLKCLKLGVAATVKDDNNILLMTDKSIVINGKKGDTFSLLPYGDSIYDLSIAGAKYNLKGVKLELGSALTVSNEFLEEEVQITFKKGILLIIFPME